MYRFYSSPKDSNRVTIVGETVDGTLKIAAARCSHNDHFVRKVGRDIAEKRLQNNETIFNIPVQDCSITFFVTLARGLAQELSKHYVHKLRHLYPSYHEKK